MTDKSDKEAEEILEFLSEHYDGDFRLVAKHLAKELLVIPDVYERFAMSSR